LNPEVDKRHCVFAATHNLAQLSIVSSTKLYKN